MAGPSFQQSYQSGRLHSGYVMHTPLDGHPHHSLQSVQDDYDDGDDDGLGELPPGSGLNGYSSSGVEASGNKAGDKQVRRRSSKACDQCRKSKCKCERSSPAEPCKNCILLGTACTFLGPSRKRGPPKGYIDAIEARLHQTEALVGILLASKDSRAKSLLEDLSEDSLAKEIIDRVNNSPYGHKGRKRGGNSGASRTKTTPSSEPKEDNPPPPAQPIHEWQDTVTSHLNSRAAQRNTAIANGESFGETGAAAPLPTNGTGAGKKSDDDALRERNGRPVLSVHPPRDDSVSVTSPGSNADGGGNEQPRRQKRRVDNSDLNGASSHANSPASTSLRSPEPRDVATDYETQDEDEESGEDELALAVGQLSMNEDLQVRYHGKASGLHLLNASERDDGRSEGGIWRFPKARVWPPIAADARTPTKTEDEWSTRLPSLDIQEHLLEVYFTYVHSQLPIVHKKSFMEIFRTGNLGTMDSPQAASTPSSQGGIPRMLRIPTLLLLSMFSIAARYSTVASPPPVPGAMWVAGDDFMADAKVILDSSYAQSRPSTCQALLLLGYREIGIGAMAQAWLYIGMAVRMAQDLGLHKNADQWHNVGQTLFTSEELQERKRIWYGCVVMDKYVSSYIGRPVAIFEHDFDTELPSVEESDELETWATHLSPVYLDDGTEEHSPAPLTSTGRVISCFNESAKLSIILSMIMQTIYPIRPHSFRQTEFTRIEQLLNKWYIELPEHLRFDANTPKYATLPPHILTLHMQYWCTVLLLHRPFIRHLASSNTKGLSPTSRETELRANSRKHYDQCVQAANMITSVVAVFIKHHCPRRASVFLCYYVFSAAVMHVQTLTAYPSDPPASSGLRKCVEMLERMQRVWPSAWRAKELIHGSKVQALKETAQSSPERMKRAAESHSDDIRSESRLTNGGVYRQAPPVYTDDGPTGSQMTYPLNLDSHHAESPTYYQSYPRWTPNGALGSMSGSLSTSVLPQTYSTGLIDERIQRHPDRQGRYPQYWNDYSSLGQMDPTYALPVINDLANDPQAGQSMYMPDQYSIYSASTVF
ncbi:fungal-specific transcription factor domain-containing protein [Irpex rosettiformis]|uniref:Fungal-specific transcription factor domain-containing protein n=1 Tax=Irpex rosettiformis TaxID=378272 RepID=A0ACB8U287_9APHY|nr:fungal-specific transcription factor domain-containing protein [Irpex rosettiformis]